MFVQRLVQHAAYLPIVIVRRRTCPHYGNGDTFDPRTVYRPGRFGKDWYIQDWQLSEIIA